MAKPTTSIKGFIEVTLEKAPLLLALHNIVGVANQQGRAVVTLRTPLGRFDPHSRVGVVEEPYDEILARIKEAS